MQVTQNYVLPAPHLQQGARMLIIVPIARREKLAKKVDVIHVMLVNSKIQPHN